ncbi:GH20783 [Drosophila grimshawi]|uniref:GH20783 n=2 Tax=Drosophila grimshawi TaxID=7222 RepID=B4J694_DROGR|nr:GH20783 [Drosophila grimshawi]
MSGNGGLMPFRFTDERHMKFVELYRREPCLWNRRPYLNGARNAAYRRIQLGINAEADITENHLTLEGVKMKIKNMRTGYHQELKKIRANPEYKPKIPWFAPLHSFVAQFVDKKSENGFVDPATMPLKRFQIKLSRFKQVKPLPLMEPEEQPVIKMELEPDQQVIIPATTVPLMPTLTPPPPLRLITPPVQPAAQSPVPVPQMVEVAALPMKKPKPLLALGEDEFTFFGLSVGAQLRSMPLSNAMIMQSKIQYMLSTERRRIGGDTTDVSLFL